MDKLSVVSSRKDGGLSSRSESQSLQQINEPNPQEDEYHE